MNTDGRFKVAGAHVNFIIHYDVDDDNSKHALSLVTFGEKELLALGSIRNEVTI